MKRLTWILGNGEVDCNKSKDECFYLHEEGNGGCWACDLFPKIIERLAEVENILGNEYDLNDLAELVKSKQAGRVEVFPCNPGDDIWVVERDEEGEIVDFSGNVFVCKVNEYCIVSPYINGSSDIDYILSEQAAQTVMEYNGDFSIYPACDCYMTREEAEAKVNEEEW